jgi:hypothetical protein
VALAAFPPQGEGAGLPQASSSQGPSSTDAEKSRIWGVWVGWREVKFQTVMQKSFTCKAHLQIPPLKCSFSILHFSFSNSSSSFFHLVSLLPAALLACRQEPQGLERHRQVSSSCMRGQA